MASSTRSASAGRGSAASSHGSESSSPPSSRQQRESALTEHAFALPSCAFPYLFPHGVTAASSALYTPRYAPSLVCAVLSALAAAHEAAPVEVFAATKIQATFHMFREGKQYRRVRRCVVTIQRVYRGYVARKRLHAEAQHAELVLQRAMYDYFATRIQACYRGFHSRRHISHYAATKRYVQEVTARSAAVCEEAEQLRIQQEAALQAEAHARDLAAYTAATENVHHLVSTAAIGGVYRRPLCVAAAATTTAASVTTMTAASSSSCTGAAVSGTAGADLGATRTVFNTNVEDDIRANAAKARRRQLNRQVHANQSSKVVPQGQQPRQGRGKEADVKHAAVEDESPLNRSSPCPPSAAVVAAGAVDGAAAATTDLVSSLPPIKRTKQRAPVLPAYATVGPSVQPACSWQDVQALPPQRPLVQPADLTASQPRRTRKTGGNGKLTATSQGVLTVTRDSTNVVGSSPTTGVDGAGTGRRRRGVAKHHCEAGDTAREMGPVYDMEQAALQRRVDAKLKETLHGAAPFKVATRIK